MDWGLLLGNCNSPGAIQALVQWRAYPLPNPERVRTIRDDAQNVKALPLLVWNPNASQHRRTCQVGLPVGSVCSVYWPSLRKRSISEPTRTRSIIFVSSRMGRPKILSVHGTNVGRGRTGEPVAASTTAPGRANSAAADVADEAGRHQTLCRSGDREVQLTMVMVVMVLATHLKQPRLELPV